MSTKIILASSSRYRRALLERLQINFSCLSPEIDESALPEETPTALVERLAIEKAQVIAAQYPDAVVIGSDQLASINGMVLGKPGNHANAIAQLKLAAGNTVQFLTAVSVQKLAAGFSATITVPVTVKFRDISDLEIDGYLQREQPYDCAGSFKSESLGIVLFEKITSDDPTALEGLPLIQTAQLLRDAGLNLLAQPAR